MIDSQTITVGLGDRSYPILIGHQILDRLAFALASVDFPRKIALVTNETVEKLYADSVVAALADHAAEVEVIAIPDGENYKTLATLETVFSALIEKGFDRSSGLLALGGGVVGDLAGFAAACYLRGIPFVQLPTTLLAQVDSSVGGKTAVNHALGKNLIGAFYQPQLVLIDVDLLKTLPERELKAGLAEVVKYGVIRDAEFFAWLEDHVDQLLALQPETLIQAILTACRIKAEIVEADELEHSTRAILNYGHTFGHAVEQLSGYGVIRHGEAVAIGMQVAAKISVAEGLSRPEDADRISSLLQRIGLPVEPPLFSLDACLAAMARDKKVHQGTLRYVVNRGLGDCLLRDIADPREVFSRVLAVPVITEEPVLVEESVIEESVIEESVIEESVIEESAAADASVAGSTSSLLGKIASYTEILARDAKSTAFVPLSQAYQQIGMLADAAEVAWQGTRNLPGFTPGFIALGEILAEQGELPRAAEVFGRALKLENTHPQALMGLARICRRQGDSHQVRELLLTLLRDQPDDRAARELLDSLEPPAPSTAFAQAAATPAAVVGPTAVEEEDLEADAVAPQPIPTETVADLYRKQGLLKEAAAIYRDILRIDAHRDTVRDKLVEVKRQLDAERIGGAGLPPLSEELAAAAAGAEREAVILDELVDDSSPDQDLVDLADPVSRLEQWLVSIEKRRAHVQ